MSEDIKNLPIKISKHHNKQVVGALLAELVQAHYDKSKSLDNKMYEAIVYKVSRDSEIVRYAEAWMDYQLEVFDFCNKEYWIKVKTYLRDLPKRREVKE